MGLYKRLFIVVRCDNCKISFENSEGGYQCFESKGQARETIKSCDWTVKNGRTLCPACFEQ